MRELNNCKKGVLFTIGLTFLAMVVLSLAILIFHSAQKSEDIVAKLAVLDRVYDLGTSIEQSLSDIFDLRSGISINITNNSVSFEEILPNENIVTFNNSLYQFKRFIERNLSNVNLSIANMEGMPLTINPGDITYKHTGNWSNIEVLPPAGYSGGYSIFIITDKNVTCSSSFNPGGFNLSYEVIGIVNEDDSCDYKSEMINPADNKRVIVDSHPGEVTIITIGVDSNRVLSVNITEGISVTARTTIPINQPPTITADSLILGIYFSDFGIVKENMVRII